MARGRVANLFVKVGVNTRAFKRDMSKMSRIFTGAMARMGRVGALGTLGLTGAFIGLGVAATRASIEMNEGMANVATLIPGNIKRVKDLKNAVQDMAVATGKATKDLTGGLYQVISAFQDTADTVKILEINTRAAVAGLSSVTDAVNLTSAVTKGYGRVSAKAVQHISDLAFETVRLGVTTFPQLAQSMGRVVPTAAALGAEVEELFGLFATLTGVTGDAALVTTQLRGVLGAFLKPSAAMKEAIAGLNYENAQHIISSRGIVGALQDVIKTTDGTAESIGKLFQNRRALPAVFILAGGQAETFTRKLEAMNNATGATERAFKEQTEGINKFGHDLKKARQEVEVFKQEVGDLFTKNFARAIGVWKDLWTPSEIDMAEMMGMGVKEYQDFMQRMEAASGSLKNLRQEVEDFNRLSKEYLKLTGAEFKVPEMPEMMIAGIGGAAATDLELLTDAIRKFKLEQAQAAAEAERMAKAVEWAALQAKLIKIPELKFGDMVEAERFASILEQMAGLDVPIFELAAKIPETDKIEDFNRLLREAIQNWVEYNTAINRVMPSDIFTAGSEEINAWLQQVDAASRMARQLDEDITNVKHEFEDMPPMILSSENAIQDWNAEIENSSYITEEFAHTLAMLAFAGEDALERLTLAAERFVENWIANFVRLNVLEHLIPDWLKPFLTGNIILGGGGGGGGGGAIIGEGVGGGWSPGGGISGTSIPPEQLQSNFIPPEFIPGPPSLLTIPGPTFDVEPPPVLNIPSPMFDVEPPPVLSIAPVYDIAILADIPITPIFDVAIPPVMTIPSPMFDIEAPPILAIPGPVFDIEIPEALMIPAPVYEYEMPAPVELMIPAPIVSYAAPLPAEAYKAAPSPVAEPLPAYTGQPVNITVHDNRSADAPPVDIRERTNPLGGREIEIFITDVMKKAIDRGALDKQMAGTYRISRQGRRR